MVYLLKFGASWVLPPGIFIVIFLGIAWFAWRVRGEKDLAAVIVGVTLVFYLFCTGFVAEKLMGRLESVYEPPETPHGDVIVMLGGGAMPDSPDVDGVGSLCGSPANRLLARRAPCCLMMLKKWRGALLRGKTTASPQRAPTFVPPI